MEEEVPPASDAPAVIDNRPLNERIEDKNWKTRQVAYEELKNLVSSGEPDRTVFQEYQHGIVKMISDANAGAMDTGLDCAIAFVDAAPIGQMRGNQEKIASTVVDKAFGTRAGTLAKGKALCLKLMELDEAGPVTAVLLSKLGDKKPKVPPTCLEIIKEGVGLFGARAFPVRDIIGSLAAVLNGTNGPAREVALALMVDMSIWIGRAPFNSVLDGIRTAQKTEFEKLVAEREAESAGKSMSPSLWLKKDRPAPGSEPATTAAAGNCFI
jgi:cytoskeleton-associated protein 5